MVRKLIRPLAICVFRRGALILVAEGYDPTKQQAFYRPLGGTIEFGERSDEAVVREVREELGAEINNLCLLGTLESVFTYDGQPGHEIVLVYQAEFADCSIYERAQLDGIEDGAVAFKAVWKPLSDFASDRAILYPEGLAKLLSGLAPMRDMLQAALAGGYAIGYFEAWDQHSLEAVLEAAEESRSPVILGFGGELIDQRWYDGGGQRRLAALGVAAAAEATVPVSLLFNEVANLEQVRRGLAWGFNAVMLDTSELPFDENVAATRRVVEAAHALGADVEGEINRLPDASGTLGGPAAPELTDPQQAARYVAETGVDALSISTGNVHILMEGEARIDLDHLARLRRAVEVPLVIHGGTGFPDHAVPRAIELGVAKFNVGSVMKQVFLDRLRQTIAALPARVNLQEAIGSRKAGDILQPAKDAVKAEVMRRMTLYGSAGRA